MKNIDTNSPQFGTVAFNVATVWGGSIADITFLVEDGSTDWIIDGDTASSYILGMSSTRDLLIARIEANGDYGDYAVLTGVQIDWNGQTPIGSSTVYGAAYTYEGSGSPRIFFSANNGYGFFELGLPIEPALGCWNDVNAASSTHTACAGNVVMTWRAPSESTSLNDGFSCFEASLPLTYSPTESPTPSPSPSPTRSPTEGGFPPITNPVDPWDCVSQVPAAPLYPLSPPLSPFSLFTSAPARRAVWHSVAASLTHENPPLLAG